MALVLGICAAFLYALGANLQQAEARLSRGGALFTWLTTRPRWFAGIAINGLGLFCQAEALGHGPLMLVQPLLVLSLVFGVSLAHVREPISRREVLGVVAVVAGLLMFFPTVREEPPVTHDDQWLHCAVAVLVLVAVCFVAARGRLAATLMASASGLLFGLGATTLKATMAIPAAAVLMGWPLYATIAANAAGFWLLQQAFAAGRLAASFPAVLAVDPITSAALGAILFGERVQPLPLAVAGALCTLLGIVLLGAHAVAPPEEHLEQRSEDQTVNHEHG